jgi:tryptophan 2,3-dioxygenase
VTDHDDDRLNYATYLGLDRLLDLQRPRSSPPEHDETLFIVFHQVCELWFTQLLHELDKVCRDLPAGDIAGAVGTFTRVRRILKVVVDQLDVLETMTPMSFNAFRERLDRSSGFQSMQFRELEFVLGYKRADVLDHFPSDLPGIDRARRRLAEPSVVDALHRLLAWRGVPIPPEIRDRPVTEPAPPSEVIQDGILRLYRTDLELRVLFELMTDVDELLQLWRYRHVKLVERTIGNKTGTGGSLGVAFLRETLFRPVFPDLWAMRHRV